MIILQCLCWLHRVFLEFILTCRWYETQLMRIQWVGPVLFLVRSLLLLTLWGNSFHPIKSIPIFQNATMDTNLSIPVSFRGMNTRIVVGDPYFAINVCRDTILDVSSHSLPLAQWSNIKHSDSHIASNQKRIFAIIKWIELYTLSFIGYAEGSAGRASVEDAETDEVRRNSIVFSLSKLSL